MVLVACSPDIYLAFGRSNHNFFCHPVLCLKFSLFLLIYLFIYLFSWIFWGVQFFLPLNSVHIIYTLFDPLLCVHFFFLFPWTFSNYGVPLHLIRELYETFHNFKTRVADYIRYRKITSNMNLCFPDATPEELNG